MSVTNRQRSRRLAPRAAAALAPVVAGLSLLAVVTAPAPATAHPGHAPAHARPGPPVPLPGPGRPTPPPPTTSEYLPGVEADLYLPARKHGTVPVIVMIPGGGWQTADRSGLGQLAEAFAADGVAAYNATYRVGETAARFPGPAQDVDCAISAGVDAVKRAGLRPGKVVVLGHSAGAHLSSLAAFGGSTFRASYCPYPPVQIDGWVGLSGIYDLTVVGPYSWTMMGGTAEELPELYAQAGTETYFATNGKRQHLDALVVHGDADELGITVEYATGFAERVEAHGYETQLVIVPGANHNATFQAPLVADTILKWLGQVEK